MSGDCGEARGMRLSTISHTSLFTFPAQPLLPPLLCFVAVPQDAALVFTRPVPDFAMADSAPTQRVQFGEGIEPVKTKNSVSAYSKMFNRQAALDEKPSAVDIEESAVQKSANEDLNKKNKQVCGLARYL